MGVGDDAAAAAERHHRRVDQFGQLEDLVARVDRAAADEDHRRLAAAISAAADLIRSGSGSGAGNGSNDFAAPTSARCVNTSHGISSATGPRRPDSISWNARDDQRRRGIGIFDALGPFDEGPQGRKLVRHLVQMAAALAEKCRRHLAGQAQHRLVRSERGQQRRAGIEHARAGHHAEYAGPAAGARIAIGHVAAGLLVARADHLQLRLMEGVEQAIDLRAGQAEHGVDAVRDKAADDGFAAGTQGHCIVQSSISRGFMPLARMTAVGSAER